MTVGPFPVSEVIDRLETVKAIKFVGSAADLETARKQEPAMVPAAYVLTSERGEKNIGATSGAFIQNAEVSIAVVLFVRNYSQGNTGAKARADMDALQCLVRKALIGWSPSLDFRPLGLQGSRDEFYNAGLLCLQEIYRTNYRIEVRS